MRSIWSKTLSATLITVLIASTFGFILTGHSGFGRSSGLTFQSSFKPISTPVVPIFAHARVDYQPFWRFGGGDFFLPFGGFGAFKFGVLDP